MIDPELFYQCLETAGFHFFTGVPDTLLAGLCSVMCEKGTSRHITAANEGNAVALATGHYLATGNPAVVYMQNSGLGNAINPLLSLADELVYKIPMLLIIGWRGEPGVKDEPQHAKQGMLTLPLLNTMGIESVILSDIYQTDIARCAGLLRKTGKPTALIVKKGLFANRGYLCAKNNFPLSREQAMAILLSQLSSDDIVVTTTGKGSRELYELREHLGHGHAQDFLCVGSMGHAASIALGLSLATNRRVLCVDGDGAFLMHMGGTAVMAQHMPPNLKYIIMNNGAHESVGGQATIGFSMDLEKILLGMGFRGIFRAETEKQIIEGLSGAFVSKKGALIVYTNTYARRDLGRPQKSPAENKTAIMNHLRRDTQKFCEECK